jgi:hypothetical protein
MSIEEMVRAELRSVADQVVVPSLPPLAERRRAWPVVVAAAAAMALVITGLAWALRDHGSPPPVDPPKRVEIDRSAPTIPWLDRTKLYVDGEQIPGQWSEMVSGGETWVARREDLHAVWGRGTEQHDLGKVGWFYGSTNRGYVEPLGMSGPFLSPGGRYLAYGGDQGNQGRTPLRLLDTQTGRSTALPARFDKHDIDAVTDAGLLLTSLWPDPDDPEGRPAVREHWILGVGREPERLENLGGELLNLTGAPGLMLVDSDDVVWVVELVDSQVRRAVKLGLSKNHIDDWDARASASLSPDWKWLLDLRWADEQEEPATVSVTAVDTGVPTSVSAPDGWAFAPRLVPVLWESATFVTWVVEPETRTYRVARCAPALGACVLVEES